MTLKGRVILNEQEESGNSDFSITEKYMTAGFQHTFGNEAVQVAFTAVSLIMETYPDNACYFQSFRYIYPNGEVTKFWCIHDYDYYTFLLPEEY